MAYDATYGNALKRMVTNPDSFQGTPGFKFALNTGLDAVGRRSAAGGMRGSGNALAALAKYGTGLAQQDYGAQMDRLARINAQEQGNDLGQQGIDLSRERLGLDTELGRGQLGLGRERLGLDRELGMGRLGLDTELGRGQLALGQGRLGLDTELGRGQLDLGRGRLGLDRDLGMGRLGLDTTRAANEYELGLGQNANTAQRNQFDYTLGLGANANTSARNQNDFNLGLYNAQTNRGNSLADIYFRRQRQQPHTFNTPAGQVTTFPRFD